jgi:hypothetical protein
LSPVRGHELNPAYRSSFDTNNVKIHSAQGFRQAGNISLAKPDNVFRIFMLGGSTLYGLGVQAEGPYPKHRTLMDDETVTAFLETELNKAFMPAALK